MARLRASYQELGRELDLGGEDTDITLFASLEISLTDPDASGEVSSALADDSAVERVLTKQAEYDTLKDVVNDAAALATVPGMASREGAVLRLKLSSDRTFKLTDCVQEPACDG